MDLLEKMSTYVRVIEAGSFSAAAVQLRVSPAAVSRQVATLEAELKVPLLLRSTRRMTVTAAGRRYYERCQRVLREVDEAQASARESAAEGLVRVTAPVSFGLARVVPHVRALMDKHPALRVDLSLEDRMLDLTLEGVDVAIRVGRAPPSSTELIAQRIFSFRRVVVASPSYVKRKGEPTTPEALADHDALSYLIGAMADHWTLQSEACEARVRVRSVFGCNALHAIRDLTLQGMGVAWLPDWFVAPLLAKRELKRLLPAWQSDPVEVHAIHRKAHRGASRVRLVVDHLREVYAT